MQSNKKKWQDIQDIFHYNLLPQSVIEQHMPKKSLGDDTQHERYFYEYFRFLSLSMEAKCTYDRKAIKRAWLSQNKNISKKKILVPGFLQVKQKDVNALHYLIQALREPERVVESLTSLNNSLFDAYNATKKHLTEEQSKNHLKLLEDLYHITWFLWELCRKP